MIGAIGASSRAGNTGALGRNNELLWRIPDDLKRFKAITRGHVVIMGRKTYESIGRPLPDRTNIVITRDDNAKIDGCIVVNSIEQALDFAREHEDEEIFIIGGAQIHAQALPFADKLYLTLVESDEQGDVFFPPYPDFTKVTFEEPRSWNGLNYTWVDIEKE